MYRIHLLSFLKHFALSHGSSVISDTLFNYSASSHSFIDLKILYMCIYTHMLQNMSVYQYLEQLGTALSFFLFKIIPYHLFCIRSSNYYSF